MEAEFSHCQMSWVLTGDLSCICSQEEKVEGRNVSFSDIKWLRDFMDNTGSVDLQFIGNKFTWQNNRFSGGLIRERLDRALCSPEWLLEYASAGVRNLPISISDHAPIILDTHMFIARGFIPFRFFEALSWEDSCKQVIASAWSSSGGTATGTFIRNIHQSKIALQAWKKNLKGINDGEIKDLEGILVWIQNQPIIAVLKEEELRVQTLLSAAWSKLESMWRQKSKETWLALGDRNTSFFHAATIIRKRRNSIWSLKDKEGKVWKDRKHIGEVIYSHFMELFTSAKPVIDEMFEGLFVNKIDSLSNEKFASIPSDEEIKEAVFSLHPLKAPGPDGFSGCFYHKYWDVVGANLCTTVKEFFSSGRILRPLMNDLVYPFQSAFILGRWIAESSILTQEIIHKILHKRGRGGLMALKLDMHKAYDKMEWDFLDRVLRANGFNERCRQLLMACVTSVSYSVLLNGCPLKKLIPQRGLRQGDPMSPFLFLLRQEVLSKLICKAEGRGLIHGIKIALSAPPVSHLMFADDTILFARANNNEAEKLMECISTYEKWSGQSCSKPKSSVLFSKNITRRCKDQILGNLNIDQVRGEERHLGNPFVFKRRKKEDYVRLKDNIMKKLEGWKMKLLSYAGRLTLIKSVTSAMPIYAMSTSKIPISTCRELDSMMRKYWWIGNVDKDRYLALKAWDQICQQKASGVLGLRKCEDMNKALLSKLAWSLAVQVDKPWVKCLLGKYYKHESFWSVKKKSSDSFQWRGILESREAILKGYISIVASGCSINFWHRPWIPWLEFNEFAELMESIRGRGYTIQTLRDVSIDNDWNEEICPRKKIWKWIWDAGIHPRNSVLLWKILNEAIPTKNRLHFLHDKTCNICEADEENAFHLFRSCSFSKAIWFGGRFSFRINDIPGDNLISMLEGIIELVTGVERKELINYIGYMFSEIWFQRNAFCIRNAEINLSYAVARIEKSYAELQNLVTSKKGGLSEARCTYSIQEPEGYHGSLNRQRCNVIFSDASWFKGDAGIAAVSVEISTGCWHVKTQKIRTNSVLEAELKAILLALSMAIELGWQEVHILSDSKIAVQALSPLLARGVPDWRVADVYYNIVNLSKKFLSCRFFFINRNFNVCANGVAKTARVSSELAVLYQGEGNPPVVPIYFLNQ
ncbi:uncharacterized protein LOC133035897 [Cannabis sativa]|uniref:uncharacterized protein LOC133035897 n=1 Tax=Cannabis sativa TaxID=3483 RepID=UPI0029CA9769|nr:uncharacterized protein LOC133035897 [Cannabis sativa]